MTLEASLVVPMIICVFALLIYFSYYLYGRCVLSQDTYILAFRASISSEDAGSVVSEKEDGVLGRKYFGSGKPVISVSTSGKDIRVSGKSYVRSRAMGSYFLKPRSDWNYETAGKARKLKQIDHIRMVKRVKDIGENLLNRKEEP
ncbi:hypothetical protein D6853_12225 [Butyrivibrio sp. X503]|nr:hypothetical protein D6853_12225 [Butyrivibrio sp. X503]